MPAPSGQSMHSIVKRHNFFGNGVVPMTVGRKNVVTPQVMERCQSELTDLEHTSLKTVATSWQKKHPTLLLLTTFMTRT